jgi:hypothetical protein
LSKRSLAPVRPIESALKAAYGRYCSLTPGLGVKLSNDVLAGPTVLCAVGGKPSA